MKTIFKNNFCKTNRLFQTAGIYAVLFIFMQSCVMVNPGEIALKVEHGKIQPENFGPGKHPAGAGSEYIVFSTRIKEVSTKMTLPTKEGLEAKIDLTLLYHIKPEKIHDIYLTLGMNYEKDIIMNNFAAIARETCLNYRAMDLMTQRDSLENAIFGDMNTDLGHYGFVIDQILVRDIDVPDELIRLFRKKCFRNRLPNSRPLIC